MARDFDGSTQWLQIDAAGVTGYPLTLACWVWFDSGATGTFLSVGDKDAADQYDALQRGGGSVIWAITNSAGASDSPATFTNGAWHHVAGVFTSSTSRLAYVDGAAGTVDTVNLTPNARDRTTIAARGDSSLGTLLDGRVAEAAVWNVALSGAEVLSIANQSQLPTGVQAANLVGYWPLCGVADPEPDLDGGTGNLTLVGSPPAIAHPFASASCGGGLATSISSLSGIGW